MSPKMRRLLTRLMIRLMREGSLTARILHWFFAATRFGAWRHRKDLFSADKEMPKGHRELVTKHEKGLFVTIVPYNHDNYSYIVRSSKDSKQGVVIDCGDARRVINACKDLGVDVVAVLTTHKHWDHCYGNPELQSQFPQAEFVGGSVDKPLACTRLVNDLETWTTAGLKITCHNAFGHTKGHVLYQIEPSGDSLENAFKEVKPNAPLLFTGDVIFRAGIGKTFEGTSMDVIGTLDMVTERFPRETPIYPGHEYGLDDLRWATYAEPLNDEIDDQMKMARHCAMNRTVFVPTYLGLELRTNPFMRTVELCGTEDVTIRAAKLKELRANKDEYFLDWEENDRKTDFLRQERNARKKEEDVEDAISKLETLTTVEKRLAPVNEADVVVVVDLQAQQSDGGDKNAVEYVHASTTDEKVFEMVVVKETAESQDDSPINRLKEEDMISVQRESAEKEVPLSVRDMESGLSA